MSIISQQRKDTLLARGRKGIQGTSKVPFKDGSLLAFLYSAGLVVANMALVIWAHRAFTRANWGLGGAMQIAGCFAITVCAVLGTRLLLRMLSPRLLLRNSRVCLLTIITLIAVGITACLQRYTGLWLGEHNAVAVFLYPYAVVPALATLLLRQRRAGVAAGIGASMLMGMYETPRDNAPLVVFFLGILTAMILPYLLTNIRKRIRLLRALMLSSLLLLVGVYIFSSMSPERVGQAATLFFDGRLHYAIGLQVAACLVGSVAYTVLILVILPLFERFFGVCSDIALNGFADLSNPLLERLATEAPGTYTHCLTTATIATAAADRIDASALLVRVGCFYHDVGKLGAPPMFIENTTPERNPHNTLNPSTSATWVRSHVKDGVVLAHKAGLPPAVIDIIRQHHGTTPMSFFLQRAREQAKAEESRQPQRMPRVLVDESQFRYEGPRPATKEAAIVMLADSVEAAGRSLANGSPSAIDHLVETIVETKLKDGQLDDTPLTLLELTAIKKAFVASLGTILHVRMRYPKEEKKDEKPDAPPTL